MFLGHIEENFFQNICFGTCLCGAFLCFIPTIILAKGDSIHDLTSKSWQISNGPSLGESMSNESVQYISLINFSVAIPSIMDAAADLLYQFVYSYSERHTDTLIAQYNQHVLGTSTAERFLFLLGIQIASIMIFISPRFSPCTAINERNTHAIERFGILVTCGLSAAFTLCGCSLMMCLYRNYKASFPRSKDGPVFFTTLLIAAIVCGNISFAFASVSQNPSNANFSAAIFYTIVMVAFVTMVARWASQIFAFRNRLGNIKVKADQIYVPSVFVMTFALNAIFLTLSSYTALSKDNAQILGGYRSGLTTFFALSIIASLLVIILEIRLKKIEIARNLEALESKRSFVRYISHEVRTPLNTVSLGLELLEEELTTDTSSRAKGYSESVTQIKSAAAIAVDVLNDLLQYEKMKDNTLQMFRAVHPATDVVTEVLETFKIQARRAGVSLIPSYVQRQHGEVTAEMTETLVLMQQAHIDVDKPKIAQVIRNLISNALKFTPRGGKVTVSIRFSNRLGPGRSTTAARSALTSIAVNDDDLNVVGGGAASSATPEPTNPLTSPLRVSGLTAFFTKSGKNSVGIDPISMPNSGNPSPFFDAGGSSGKRNKKKAAGAAANRRARNASSSNVSQQGQMLLGMNSRAGGGGGGGRVSVISGVDQSLAPKYIIIEVIDTGAGIEKSNIKRVFNEVVQFNPNELQGGGGSGLGLVLSRGIVAAHNGKIWLTSDGLGKGCTFAFGLPVYFRERGAAEPLPMGPLRSRARSISKALSKARSRVASRKSGVVSSMRSSHSLDTAAHIVLNRSGGPSRRPSELPGTPGAMRSLRGSSDARSNESSKRGSSLYPQGQGAPKSKTSPWGSVAGLITANGEQAGGGLVVDRTFISSNNLGRMNGSGAADGEGGEEEKNNSGSGKMAAGRGLGSGPDNPNPLLGLGHMAADSSVASYSNLKASFSLRRNSDVSIRSNGGSFIVGAGSFSVRASISGPNGDKAIGAQAQAPSIESSLVQSDHSISFRGLHSRNQQPEKLPVINEKPPEPQQKDTSRTIPRALSESHQRPRRLTVDNTFGSGGGGTGDDEIIAFPSLADDKNILARTRSSAEMPSALTIHRPSRTLSPNEAASNSTASAGALNTVNMKYHVLVVDDSALNRRMICRALAAINCSAAEAEDGIVAVQMVARSMGLITSDEPINGKLGSPLSRSRRASLREDAGSEGGASGGNSRSVTRRPSIAEQIFSSRQNSFSLRRSLRITSEGRQASSTRQGSRNNSSQRLPRAFDFILCDNVMPRMDGPTAVKKIRSLGFANPIFGVTGNVLASDIEQFIYHGANTVLPKPLKLAALKQAIAIYITAEENGEDEEAVADGDAEDGASDF